MLAKKNYIVNSLKGLTEKQQKKRQIVKFLKKLQI